MVRRSSLISVDTNPLSQTWTILYLANYCTLALRYCCLSVCDYRTRYSKYVHSSTNSSGRQTLPACWRYFASTVFHCLYPTTSSTYSYWESVLVPLSKYMQENTRHDKYVCIADQTKMSKCNDKRTTRYLIVVLSVVPATVVLSRVVAFPVAVRTSVEFNSFSTNNGCHTLCSRLSD